MTQDTGRTIGKSYSRPGCEQPLRDNDDLIKGTELLHCEVIIGMHSRGMINWDTPWGYPGGSLQMPSRKRMRRLRKVFKSKKTKLKVAPDAGGKHICGAECKKVPNVLSRCHTKRRMDG